MPAWFITVTAENGFAADGPVTVTFGRAVEAVTDALDAYNLQRDMTYHIDPDPRSHNVLRGKMVRGVINTEPKDVRMIADTFIMAQFLFAKARMRLPLLADGFIDGYIGGYMPVDDIWYSFANQGHIKEYSASMDLPGIYYALHKVADADPDPATGKNRRISSAYRIEATPAFLLPAAPAGPAKAKNQRASTK
jgi:hypothetical protein